ncbi:Lrp/AsnC family transcriptional regulator [uncultured Microbacterium sp.]|uniref:Lrp/AsnC family transcriptional regulator n=1 Tax=uncultured Microbacterium sp. TaxID=191216 RepID=UPI0035C9E38B
MKNSVHFDETNIALLEALRANPRAPWEAIGQAVGVDGVTARRRWNRIVERRHAWTTVSTGNWPGQVTATVTAQCAAGSALSVARELAESPFVVTIETIIGRHDLRCTVVVDDMDTLTRLLSRDLLAIPGLISIESQLVDRVFAQGSNWRPGALTAVAERVLHVDSADRRAHSDRLHAIDPALVELLVDDVRAPAIDLAAKLGVSETVVRRRISSLVRSGLLVLRVEAPPHLVGLPYGATIWFSLPARALHSAATFLAGIAETRWTATVLAGAANLMSVFWLRDFGQLQSIEQAVEERYPDARIVDRAMRLQPVKRMMHVLDDEGLTVRTIPSMPRWSK